MKRIAASFLYLSSSEILSQGVLELSEDHVISDIFSLQNLQVESANTLFFSGILFPPFISLKKHIDTEKLKFTHPSFQYIDSFDRTNLFIEKEQFILDFSQQDFSTILKNILLIQEKHPKLSLLEIIEAASLVPEIILKKEKVGFFKGKKTAVWLLEQIDSVNLKLLPTSTIFSF